MTRPPEGSPEEIIWLRGHEAGVEQMRKDTRPIIDQLRADNAALWERVKRWEPGADPAAWGSGSMLDKRET